MSEMVTLLESFDLPELFTQSKLEGVRFFKSKEHMPRTPLFYDPGLFIVAQGQKRGYLADQEFQYDANNYLVTSVPTPFECETFASSKAPFLGLNIDIDMVLLHEMIGQLAEGKGLEHSVSPKGVAPAEMDRDMYDAVLRLLKCVGSQTETTILGRCLVKEILYRALCGTQAASLYALANHAGHFARVSKALKSIHNDYAAKPDVESLARIAGMSVSAFHRAFKEVTSVSPIQYLKKVRLNKALNLIKNENMKAYLAADTVGYESVSQFSREFKRYFGKTPTEVATEK